MKKIIIFLVAVMGIGCNLSQPSYNKVTIAQAKDSTKIVSAEIHSLETVAFVVSNAIPDSLILASIK